MTTAENLDVPSSESLPPRPATLFHYTTAAGLLGILGGLRLWATDLRFLNDAQESLYGEPVVVDAVRSTPNPVLNPKHWAHQHGQAAIDTFADYQGYILEELTQRRFVVFVTCLCDAGDLLSQWRGYGSDHGYAIELRSDMLQTAVGELGVYPPAAGLTRVTYGRDNATAIAEQARETIIDFNLNHPGTKAHFKAGVLAALAATVKHPTFSEEREWRLFATLERSDIAPRSNANPFGGRIRFRSTPMAIVPYIELDLPIEAIVSVCVGPGSASDVREAGVRALLDSVGSDAQVRRSQVPLR